eukprot:SAG31_NODE_2500_length_5595_cov_4.571143_1_plen_119_part_00
MAEPISATKSDRLSNGRISLLMLAAAHADVELLSMILSAVTAGKPVGADALQLIATADETGRTAIGHALRNFDPGWNSISSRAPFKAVTEVVEKLLLAGAQVCSFLLCIPARLSSIAT